MGDSRGSRRQSDAPTILALIALIGAALGLIGLTALVLPQVGGLALVVGGFTILGMLQYLIWGRWMSREIRRDDQDASE